MRLITCLAVILSVISIPDCSPVCECANQPASSYTPKEIRLRDSTMNISAVKRTAEKFSTNPNFFLNIILHHDKLYACFMTTDSKLVFANLEDSNDVQISPLPFLPEKGSVMTSYYKNGKLYLLESLSKIFHELTVGENFHLVRTKRIELDKIVDISNWYIHVQPVGNFFVENNQLIFPYNIRGGFNYVDSTMFLRINFENKTYTKFLSTPACLETCAVYSESPVCALDSNKAYFIFSNLNLMICQDAAGPQQTFTLPSDHIFKPYDTKQSKNMAYSRNYELLREYNQGIFTLPKGYVIMRRLARKKITEPVSTELLFYNQTHSYQGSKFLPFAVQQPRSYQDKVFFINDSFTKAFFYAPD